MSLKNVIVLIVEIILILPVSLIVMTASYAKVAGKINKTKQMHGLNTRKE